MIIFRNVLLAAGLIWVSLAAADVSDTRNVLPAPLAGVTKSSAGFYHPGVLVNRAQLDFVKSKITAGIEPWKSAFQAAKSDALGSVSYTPHPWKMCNCGPYSRPDSWVQGRAT